MGISGVRTRLTAAPPIAAAILILYFSSTISNHFADASGPSDVITFDVFQTGYYRGVAGHVDTAYWKADTPLTVEFYEDELLLEHAKVFLSNNGSFSYIAVSPIIKTEGNYSFLVSYQEYKATKEFFNSDISEYPGRSYCERWQVCGGNMPVGNKVYPLDYNIYGHRFTNSTDAFGDVPKVRLDADAKAIVFDINAIADGRLIVAPSKKLLQSIEFVPDNNMEIELPFEVLVDGKTVDNRSTVVQGDLFWPEGRKTPMSAVKGQPFWAEEGRVRFVSIQFQAGSKQIAITGTYLRVAEPVGESKYSHGLRFVPELPNNKSNITAHIPIFYPDLCHSASFKGFTISGNAIDFEVIHHHSGGGACPEAIWSAIFQANLGQLAAGEYSSRLLINGTETVTKKLVVSSSDLEIVSTGRYTDRDDRNHIIGEIRNVGVLPVTNVSAVISFYDQNNIKIAEEYAFPEIAILATNHSSGFDYRIMNNEIKHAATKVEINHYDKIASPTNPDLIVSVDAKKFLQPYGDAFVAGKVTNNSEHLSANQTIVVCVLYDSSNTLIIDTIVNDTRPAKIEPGQTADFVAYSNYHPVDSYYSARCSAGEETIGTRVIPEFGSSLVVLVGILGGFTWIVVFSRLFRISNQR